AFTDLGVGAIQAVCEPAGGVGDCFATTSAADVITFAGGKLVGSAQRRHDGVILQQSSIRYRKPSVQPANVFVGAVCEAEFPLARISEGDLECALVQGFGLRLGTRMEPGTLTSEERAAAIALQEELRKRDVSSRFVDSGR